VNYKLFIENFRESRCETTGVKADLDFREFWNIEHRTPNAEHRTRETESVGVFRRLLGLSMFIQIILEVFFYFFWSHLVGISRI
jgi:hypothetical protein